MTDKLPGKAGGAEYEKFRAALALQESGGNPSAVQWDTKAHGLFQFIPSIHAKWIEAETGQSLSSYMPKDSSPAEMERARKDQMEKLFPAYYERELAPFIAKARKSGAGKGYTDAELGAMAHFAGPNAAGEFLKNGADSTLNTPGNAAGGIPTYLEEFGKKYGENSITNLASTEGKVQHYGEYGLGRGVYEAYQDKDLPKDADDKFKNQALKALYKASGVPDFVGNVESKKKVTAPPVDPDLGSPVVANSPASSLEAPMPSSPKTKISSLSGKSWWQKLAAFLTKKPTSNG